MEEIAIVGVVIVAERFDEQVAFYRDELGLKLTDDWGDAVRFRSSNGVELTIFAATHDRRSMERLAPAKHGLSHLEFAVNRDRRPALEAQLRSAQREAHSSNFLDADGQLFHFVN